MRVRHLALFGMLVVACASAHEPPLEDWMLGPDEWPETCEAAAADSLARLSPEGIEKLRETEFEDLILYHHGWGTGIRNRLGLWRGNTALIVSCLGEPGHPDDASMKIIELTWQLARDMGE